MGGFIYDYQTGGTREMQIAKVHEPHAICLQHNIYSLPELRLQHTKSKSKVKVR